MLLFCGFSLSSHLQVLFFFFFVADSPLFAFWGSASSGIADVAELLTVPRVGEIIQLLLKVAFMTVLLSVVLEAQVKQYLCKTVLPIPVPLHPNETPPSEGTYLLHVNNTALP